MRLHKIGYSMDHQAIDKTAEKLEATSSSLSVVIPALNEESGIEAVVQRVLDIRPTLSSYGIAGPEVIVVDDGSRDRTADIVSSMNGVRLVRHTVNRGYGAALKTGFNSATGNLLSFLDADGTYPPEYLPDLCRAILNGADLAIGSRMAGATSEMPLVRRIGNLFFAGVVSIMGNRRVSDSASGMRVFRQSVLQSLYPLPDGLNFTPVMSTRAIHEGLRMVEVPIPYRERVGRSKLNVIRDGWRFLNSIVWTALSYNPARILGMIGVIGISISAIVMAALLLARITGVTFLDQWGVFAVFSAMMFGVAGVSLFSLGAMFNYLVSLFHNKPERQGIFGKPIFHQPLERHFWWMGGAAVIIGSIVAIVGFVLSLQGWDISRLWLWLVASAMLILIGVQLVVSWVVMRVLEELSLREGKISSDLGSK
jgi:glycosyltransferase involved in cell wall biosynthesis